MAERPQIKPGDWITIGKGLNGIPAIVCAIYSFNPLDEIEVVYLDDQDRAMNADVVWEDNHWSFKGPNPFGRYADKYDRLCNFVSNLRAGKS